MSITRARFWRKIYLIFSLILGVISPLLCWYMIPEFNPVTKPLSYFGIVEITAWYWNASLILIALAIYINAHRAMLKFFPKVKAKKILHVLLITAVLSLIITALFPMDKSVIHKLSATIFFLTYNLFIFCFGALKSRKYIRRGMFSMVVGSLMLLSSLLLLPFPSYGVFEIVYFLMAILWNGRLLAQRIQSEKKLKKSSLSFTLNNFL